MNFSNIKGPLEKKYFDLTYLCSIFELAKYHTLKIKGLTLIGGSNIILMLNNYRSMLTIFEEIYINIILPHANWYCPDDDNETEFQFEEGLDVFCIHVIP